LHGSQGHQDHDAQRQNAIHTASQEVGVKRKIYPL
jgi:hypothetical protein